MREKSESKSKKEKEPPPAPKKCLTFQHCELGIDVDLASAVGGRALVNGFVPVCAQRLDPQHAARAVIKLDRLRGHSKRAAISIPYRCIATHT